jgi:hypothetical protein
MTKTEALKHFGNDIFKLADALGCRSQAVYKWPGDTVPAGRQWQLEVITKGKLKADRPKQAKSG